MDTKLKLNDFGGNFVYVKPVDAADLPQDMQDQVGDLKTLFSVHDKDGARLALVANRQLAFHLARENNLRPVTLH